MDGWRHRIEGHDVQIVVQKGSAATVPRVASRPDAREHRTDRYVLDTFKATFGVQSLVHRCLFSSAVRLLGETVWGAPKAIPSSMHLELTVP